MSTQNNGAPKPPTPSAQPDFHIDAHPGSHVSRVIAVVSGKGGVGKSSVTAMSALWSRRKGYQTAILDADITGPSIPKMFGVGYADLVATEECLYPANTVTGIKVMSMNLLSKQEDAPVIWRSPVITGAIKQFWTDVCWGYVDYMFIDMPPGTGDVPLTVFQSFPIDGIIIVTTPQDLVSMIVKKALGMAKLMKVPVLGIVENMSYVKCPHCGGRRQDPDRSRHDDLYGYGKSGILRVQLYGRTREGAAVHQLNRIPEAAGRHSLLARTPDGRSGGTTQSFGADV